MKPLIYAGICRLSPAVFLLFIGLLPLNTIAQWVQTAGPEGITVNKFYDDGTYLYAGTYAKGVFRSADHGVHWESANAGIENALVYSFISDADYLYAGTSEGVVRSADEGTTWTIANTGIEQQSVYEMEAAGGYIFAGTIGSGVFRSDDQGITWADANGGSLIYSFILAMCYANNKLIVEADNYIFYSFDFGNSWFIDQGNTAFYSIQNFLVYGDTLFASANGGVFYSYDGADNWSTFHDLTLDFFTPIVGFAISNDTLFAGYQYGVFISTDFGQSWTQVPQNGLRFGNRFHNHFIKSGQNLLLGMDELGVYVSSDNGNNWSQAIKGFIPASTIDNSMIAIGDEIWTGTHSNGVFMTSDNGSIWNKTGTNNDLDTLSNSIVFALLNPEPNLILAGTCGFGLYRSADNGLTWSHITQGLPWESGGYECDFSLEKAGPNLLLGTTDGLFYSTDNGLTWQASNLNHYIGAIAVNGGVAIAGLSGGTGSQPSGIYRSTNNGVTWTFASGVLDIVALAGDGIDHFYAGTLIGSNFRSSDNGLSWSSVGGGIPNDAGGFAIKVIGNNIFIGNIAGIFFSDDQGDSFIDVSDGMDPYPNNAVQGLTSNNQYLFAGMFRDAVWRRPLSDFGIIGTTVNEEIKKEEMVLYQNSPNPFRKGTLITYFLPVAADVSLSITDITGKVVYKTSENSEAAGFHSITCNGDELSSGIYFLKLKANDEAKVIKMVGEK